MATDLRHDRPTWYNPYTMMLSKPLPTFLRPLPGSDRKRTPSPYLYRVAYRGPAGSEPGCVMVWEVAGGRLPYQVALERTASGVLVWHCSCADAVYRGEDDPTHRCKHVQGVAEFLPPTG